MASTTTPVTSRDELLARVDAGWREFRAAIRGLGRERMGQKSPAGWTYRDLVAHAAAWEDLTARRLRRYRETGETAYPRELGTTDEFNARVVDSHRLVGAEAVLDELDTAHRRLLSAIGELSDEQVLADVREVEGYGRRSWVEAVVAGNSYGHYAEHADELRPPITREDMTERGLDGW